jgi:hypothetical protein
VTFRPVHSAGGWGQVDLYWTPCLHSHVGAGSDDPANSELAPGQIALNQTVFANLIWDVNTVFRVAAELSYRETTYVGPAALTNDSLGIHGQVQWKF